MFIVCCHSQSISIITVKKVRLVTGKPPVYQKYCRSCTEKGAITGPWWVLSTVQVKEKFTWFSVVTSWLGYSYLASLRFKTKSINSKATFLRTSFLKLQIIRLVQGHWSCMPTHWNTHFYSCFSELAYNSGALKKKHRKHLYKNTYKKHLEIHFTKGYFFCQFIDRKVVGLMPKYYLLAGDENQVSFFFNPYIRWYKWVNNKYLSLNFLSNIGVVLTISKVFTILFLLCLWE